MSLEDVKRVVEVVNEYSLCGDKNYIIID